MIFSSGCLVQPVRPARASEALASCRKPRRDTPLGHSDAKRGNSRWRRSSNSGVLASSSRLRQYSGPFLARSLSRTPSTSSRAGPGWGAPWAPHLPLALTLSIRFARSRCCPSALAADLLLKPACLAVARRAARQGFEFIVLRQLRLQPGHVRRRGFPVRVRSLARRGLHVLQEARAIARVPVHVEHLFPRPHVLRGIAVAVEAPLHLQGGV